MKLLQDKISLCV